MSERASRSISTQLQRELGKQGAFASPAQEAYLSLQRTASVLSADFAKLLKPHGLSEATYNVLRILRGAVRATERRAGNGGNGGSRGGGDENQSGEGWRTCGQIGAHMVTPVPDVTRLVDRLEARGLVTRERSKEDRRIVRVAITKAGLDLLAILDRPMVLLHEQQLAHMAETDLSRLVLLLARVRKPHVADRER